MIMHIEEFPEYILFLRRIQDLGGRVEIHEFTRKYNVRNNWQTAFCYGHLNVNGVIDERGNPLWELTEKGNKLLERSRNAVEGKDLPPSEKPKGKSFYDTSETEYH